MVAFLTTAVRVSVELHVFWQEFFDIRKNPHWRYLRGTSYVNDVMSYVNTLNHDIILVWFSRYKAKDDKKR